MSVEQYANLGATALTANYTAGDGSITVTSTTGSPAFSAAAPFRVVIADASGTVKVILKVTAITDGTHFAVTAEGTDANASSGDDVFQVLTAGAIDGIRAALQQSGSITSLPSAPKEGDIYRATDDVYVHRRAAVAWEAYGPIALLTPPGNISWTALNTPGAVTRANGSISIKQTGNGGHVIVGQAIAAPSTPYTITAAFLVNLPVTNFATAGLLWRNSGSGKIVTFAFIFSSGATIGSDKFDSFTGFNSNYFRQNFQWPQLAWLRISDDGTTRTYSFSTDGLTWLDLGTSGHTDFMTPDQVGWFVDTEASGIPGALTLISWRQT